MGAILFFFSESEVLRIENYRAGAILLPDLLQAAVCWAFKWLCDSTWVVHDKGSDSVSKSPIIKNVQPVKCLLLDEDNEFVKKTQTK